ncbi:MAG: DNA repair protein RecN [Deltaproteobacteria bacterium]|nr:DNA repair protein RecN [Deltaproteobacteria bacterium]
MLKRLLIQNLATVEKQVVEFKPGFNIITGATGAGKSIIIKSIELILGDKCDKDLIRVDQGYLLVEAFFDIKDNHSCKALLNEICIEPEDELTIRRKVSSTGKNQILINDLSTNLTNLSLISSELIDLHGQHSQLSLSQNQTHVNYLDSFAGHKELLEQYQFIFKDYLNKKKLQEKMNLDQLERTQKMDYIRFQIAEIEKAQINLEEDSALEEEHLILSNIDKITGVLGPVSEMETMEKSPLDIIGNHLNKIQEITKIEPKLKTISDEIQSGLISIQEAISDINRYLSALEIDPIRLEAVNARLSLLENLKRKYGYSLNDILIKKGEFSKQMDEMDKLEKNQSEMEKELKTLSESIREKAKKLSEGRNQIKDKFELAILAHLSELGLGKSRFKVKITDLVEKEAQKPSFTSKGKDHVEFLLSTNPGHPLKPLSSVASGGEISRIMLAIKTTLSQDISSGVLIFDEIDTGISGGIAETVGIKLRNLSQNRQIICVTHSPQIASKANFHLKVEKIQEDENTATQITPIENNERIQEIARFLGGNILSEKAIQAAEEMLRESGNH